MLISSVYISTDRAATGALYLLCGRDLLGDCQQVVPVHTLVITDFRVIAYSACINHDAPLWISFWVEEVVAFRTKVEGGLQIHMFELHGCQNNRQVRLVSHSASADQSWTNRPYRRMTSCFSNSATRYNLFQRPRSHPSAEWPNFDRSNGRTLLFG